MKMSKLVGRRIKEAPRDAETASHIFLLRGGYARMVSAGIYSILPIGQRVVAKIEQIVREEMNAIDGQEIKMPLAQPAELWQESGRYDSVGAELLRFSDRNDKAMVLAMTHEEATCHLARTEIGSYKQLPSMVFQLQTKYRDEARPRAGLIRVREFTMKDGYSFHADQACLEAYYSQAHAAYERIFARIGMKEVLDIESDTGMMGGSMSHEFMAIADCGEDTIFTSPDGGYRANRDIASTNLQFSESAMKAIEKVHTPGQTSIADVAAFLNLTPQDTGKAVFYRQDDGSLIFAIIRGDIEVNEIKLKNHLRSPHLEFASDEEITAIGAVPGFASLTGISTENVRIIVDPSARQSNNLVVGANEQDYHFINFNFDRDATDLLSKLEVVDIATAREGDPCPVTNEPLQMKRGIEVGNIFQLGTKYSESMGCNFLDQNGKRQPLVMGCYGIGIGRAMAAVIEQSHDKYGPIWPLAIAPFQVHICALNPKKEQVREIAQSLYEDLQAAGIETLLDDRGEKAGFAFNDADLIGVPLRIIVSPKTVAEGQVEFKTRDGSCKAFLPINDVVSAMQEKISATSV
jgi:prolyl-tRNA synthetase